MERLSTIKTLSGLSELRHYLEDKQYVSFDTETNGVHKNSTIIGFSVSAEIDIGYYVILSYWDTEKKELINLETASEAKAFMEFLKSKELIMHNAVFDCQMVENNYQVELMPSVHTDTMILGHILDENRSNGLKELSVSIFGENARKEQIEMKESVHKNGGLLTKEHYELYKADADLLAKYGAKDAILTLKLLYHFIPELYDQKLESFFYDDESMPLLRGPTYQLNTSGLRVDPEKLQNLKGTLEAECLEAKSFVHSEIAHYVKDKYPGTNKTNTFNIGASTQLAWLLFFRLKNPFYALTDGGRELCQLLEFPIPYSDAAKREFIKMCEENKGRVYEAAKYNHKTKKMGRPKKVGEPWKYISCGKFSLKKLAKKYKWAERYLEYAQKLKLLNTYVSGIRSRMQYNVIRPSFLQHGTTSGRYSSRNPNFQNLPKNDKRIKACIVSRPGKVFVGADYSQLEPRVFASISKDEALLNCFKEGKDFYSVVGMPIFEKTDCSPYKDDKNSFANKYSSLRDVSKAFALATPYGTTAFRQSRELDMTSEECQKIIDRYFDAYPSVELMMLESHEMVKSTGVVYNLFGRPRRIPEAKEIAEVYNATPHAELPYAARTLLNLSMNHRVQSTGASIMNRAAIATYKKIQELGWKDVKIILQVHDEMVLEGPEELRHQMVSVLKDAMENTTTLPGVALIAEPKIAYNLADLK